MKIDFEGLLIAGFRIRWYGVCITLGILLGVLLARRRERLLGLPNDTSLDIALFGVPSAIIGARLYYVAFSWDFYRHDLLSVLNLRQGGLAIYGGILGGLLAGTLYARRKKLSYAALLDLTAPSLALGQCVGRWGNFFNREAYGEIVTSAWMRRFPIAVYIPADGLWHYATFFYESLWCALIVLALCLAERRHFFARRGDVFCWYAFLYAVERTCVENLRTDSLYWGSFRVSQVLSLSAALAVALCFSLRGKKISHVFGMTLPVFGMAAALALGQFVLCIAFAALAVVLCAILYANLRNGAKSVP